MEPIKLIWNAGLICALIKTTFVWKVNNKSFQRFYILFLLFGNYLAVARSAGAFPCRFGFTERQTSRHNTQTGEILGSEQN